MNTKKTPLQHKTNEELLDLAKRLAAEFDRRHLVTLPYHQRLDGIIHHVELNIIKRARLNRVS